MFIITDKIVIVIGITIVAILLTALILTNIIPWYYTYILFFLCGSLIGGMYQALVHDYVIYKFVPNIVKPSIAKPSIAKPLGETDMNELSISDNFKPLTLQSTENKLPLAILYPNDIKQITDEFTKVIKPVLDKAMLTQTVVTDRMEIENAISTKHIFGPIIEKPMNVKQLALMLIGDYYLIDHLNAYASRSDNLKKRSINYLKPSYIRLAINNDELFDLNPDMIKKLTVNLELMILKIDKFINKDKPPSSIDVLTIIKILVANLPLVSDKLILINAGMAYACDAIVNRYQAKLYSSVNDSGYSLEYYTSIVCNILTGVI